MEEIYDILTVNPDILVAVLKNTHGHNLIDQGCFVDLFDYYIDYIDVLINMVKYAYSAGFNNIPRMMDNNRYLAIVASYGALTVEDVKYYEEICPLSSPIGINIINNMNLPVETVLYLYEKGYRNFHWYTWRYTKMAQYKNLLADARFTGATEWQSNNDSDDQITAANDPSSYMVLYDKYIINPSSQDIFDYINMRATAKSKLYRCTRFYAPKYLSIDHVMKLSRLVTFQTKSFAAKYGYKIEQFDYIASRDRVKNARYTYSSKIARNCIDTVNSNNWRKTIRNKTDSSVDAIYSILKSQGMFNDQCSCANGNTDDEENCIHKFVFDAFKVNPHLIDTIIDLGKYNKNIIDELTDSARVYMPLVSKYATDTQRIVHNSIVQKIAARHFALMIFHCENILLCPVRCQMTIT